MQTESSHYSDAFGRALAELARLREFSGAPAEFWPAFLGASAGLVGASQGVLALKKSGPSATWQKLAQWGANGGGDRYALIFAKQLLELAESCAQQGGQVRCLDGVASTNLQPYAIAVRLMLGKVEDTCVAAFLVPGASEVQAREALLRLELVADAPVSFQLNQVARQSRNDIERFASVLDLMVLVNAEQRFLAAAMAFCNGLAAKFQCDRVSLGWFEKGFIRLQAMSRTERFDRNMAAVKTLEIAMEETLDQDEEILYPAPEGSSLISRDHASFAHEQGTQFLCSLPLRLDGKVAGVVTCERQGAAVSEPELKQLRLCCDQAVRRLDDLHQKDRWLGARLASGAREKLARLVGVEHTWYKVLGILVSVALLLLIFLRLNYRAEAKFILRSDELANPTAPFDGFIAEVPVRVGDPVQRGQVLLSLDQKELELEESAALADLARYSREAEKARVGGALADMRIAQALADQSSARLNLVRHRLAQARLRSPFDGVLVEGEQRERLGAPVKQGEVLFRISRTDSLYVEAEVNERDIHEILTDAKGEIAFTSQPKLKFPVRVQRLIPAAQSKEGENVFLVRCAVVGKPADWWRPGMTGLAKINVGKRNLLWIVTHRTIDYLRLWLWW